MISKYFRIVLFIPHFSAHCNSEHLFKYCYLILQSGVPTVVKRDRWHLGSTGSQVHSPAWHSCGLGHDCGLDLIPGPGTPYAEGWPKMKKKRKKLHVLYWRLSIHISIRNKTSANNAYLSESSINIFYSILFLSSLFFPSLMLVSTTKSISHHITILQATI